MDKMYFTPNGPWLAVTAEESKLLAHYRDATREAKKVLLTACLAIQREFPVGFTPLTNEQIGEAREREAAALIPKLRLVYSRDATTEERGD